MRRSFNRHDDYVAFLAGQCLKLKEGKSVGDVYAAFLSLKVANPPPAFPEWRGSWRTIKLAVPAELNTALGTQSQTWLGYRSKDFARDYERKGFRPGSRSFHLFDCGSFGFTLDPENRSSQPESGAVPVVPAPDEATIKQYIEHAASKADYWDALVKAVAILREHRQSGGEVLRDWAMDVVGGLATRPSRTTAAKQPKHALRNHAIIEAVRALERCGMQAATNDREPGPACEVAAKVFSLSSARVRNIWKKR